VNSTTMVLYDQPVGREGFSGSGNWAFGEATTGGNGHRLVAPVRPLRQLAGWALLLAATTLTSAADPWAEQQKEQSQATTASAFRPSTKRRISLAEARKLALDILYRAERRREQTAREEAARGINWEETA
jgi:hypothetical protein